MAVEPCAIGAAPVFPERPAFPRHRRSGWTLTTHYYSASIVWSFVLIFLLLIWYAVEKYSFHLKGTPMRMVADPTEFAVRIVGLAHFVIAAMFLIVSPRMRTASGWGWLAALSGISVLQCWGFAWCGGKDNPLMLIAFYMYFVIHAFRDEAYFYRVRSGPAVPPEAHTETVLRWLQVVALCVTLALLVSIITIHGQFGGTSIAGTALQAVFPANFSFVTIFAATALPLIAVATFGFLQIHGLHPGGLVGMCREHAPLVKVIATTMGILLASMFVGAWTYNLVIVMHFVAWFEFTTTRIRRLPEPVRAAATWRKPMDWFKKNLLGFCTLHVGLTLLFLTLIAINHYGLRRAPLELAGGPVTNPLEFLFSAQNLYYWTIAHVTLSFFPRTVTPLKTA
jgi:hypothetical protein